jgi:peptide/nickel transport system ATP-binding protein
LGNAILQLDKATSGQILYRVRILLNLEMQQSKKLKEIQIIFQDPYSSLNPRIPIGKAIMEPMKVHGLHKMTKNEKPKRLKFSKE